MKIILYRFLMFSLLIAIFIFYYQLDYEKGSNGIPCTFKLFTGYSCSGCGTQRALHYLLHGEWGKAIYLNALFVIFLPFFLYIYYVFVEVYITKKKQAIGFFFSSKFAIIFIIILLLFLILRNLPYYPFDLFKS